MKIYHCPTPRQLEAMMRPRCPQPGQIERLYRQRAIHVAKLQAKGSVDAPDLADLDRLGRFDVAVRLWALCTEKAKQALRNDQHHQVRAAAVLAAPPVARTQRPVV